MTPEQENQYREEFEKKFSDQLDMTPAMTREGYSFVNTQFAWSAYLEARKKAQEEIFDIEKRYEKMLEDRKKYEAKIESEYEKVIDKMEKKITQLKEELEREREAVDFYANTKSWRDSSKPREMRESMKISFEDADDYPTKIIGGKLARQTQQQRKIEL